ncbi:MAG TPA: sulfurtransferase [Anaeromyxobacter sp.]|nr:sulfurtransferase [Anaeromyxobacter sp.]
MIRRAASFAALAFLLGVPAPSRAAGWANPDLLVTPDVVQANVGKPDWVVVDCRDLKAYAKGHIPGAISLGKECKKALRDPTSRVFKDLKRYESFLGKAGIGNDTHVVFYGEHKVTDTFKDATVGFWILEYLGHEKAHVLNGGLDAWTRAGKQLTNEPTIKPERTFKARLVAARYASTEEMLRIAEGKLKGVVVVDARSRQEHEGEDIRALRGGAVPNTTLNVPHADTMDREKDAASGKDRDNGFISPERVAGFYKGLDPGRRTIAYCHTGTRSTLTYLELRLLGFKDPANYDDSWIVWGNTPRYPVANEQFINFERLQKVEKGLQALEDAAKPKELAAQ